MKDPIPSNARSLSGRTPFAYLRFLKALMGMLAGNCSAFAGLVNLFWCLWYLARVVICCIATFTGCARLGFLSLRKH